MNKTRLHRILSAMKYRCYNKNHKAYKYYGGRGIKVCDDWLDKKNGFAAFEEWALNNGYSDKLTIDRIDCNKGYCPENCRWVSMKSQLNNTRRNRFITYKGQTKTISTWCEELGLEYETIYTRICRYNWPIEKSLSTKENPTLVKLTYKGQTKTLTEWANELNIKPATLYGRLFDKKWSIQRAFETIPKKRRYELTYNNETKSIKEWASYLGITYSAITHKLSRGWSIEEIVNSVKGERK